MADHSSFELVVVLVTVGKPVIYNSEEEEITISKTAVLTLLKSTETLYSCSPCSSYSSVFMMLTGNSLVVWQLGG